MGWINIPVEVVKGYTGKPLQGQKLDKDLEAVYKPIKCPTPDCEVAHTSSKNFRDHVQEAHNIEPDTLNIVIVPEMEDITTVSLITLLLIKLNDNTFSSIRKTNDSYRAGEVWRRVFIAIEAKKDIRLKKEDYDWLHQLLDRKLPPDKESGKDGEKREQQTLGMHLYGLNEDSIRQALTTLPDRRIRENEENE